MGAGSPQRVAPLGAGALTATLIGLACPYGKPSVGGIDWQPLCEVIRAGAFAAVAATGRSIRTGRPVALLVNHDWRRRLADTAGGLELIDTPEGLRFIARGVRLPRGTVGCSVKLRAIRWRRGVGLMKELLEGDVREISIIVPPHRPCYPNTWVLES